MRLAEIARVKVPVHEFAVAAPNSHQLPGRPPIETDATVRFVRGGEPVYFAQVEVQKEYRLDKYATLYAYHGSEVSKAKTGGHMIVLSPRKAEAEQFRGAENEFGEEYAYHGSYLSGEDLEPMAGKDRPFEERCLAVGMTDFSRGVPEIARGMLRETAAKDITVANLFFRTIMEEVSDVSMVEDVLQPDILEKLRGLKAFRDYEERVKAEAEAVAKEEAEARAQAARAEAEAKAEARTEAAAAKATLTATADALIDCFLARDEKPSAHAIRQISACADVRQLSVWLNRAHKGETSAEIFPEP